MYPFVVSLSNREPQNPVACRFTAPKLIPTHVDCARTLAPSPPFARSLRWGRLSAAKGLVE